MLTDEQLSNGTAVYATPLTSFVIAHAYQIADRSNLPSNPIQDGLLGDNNGTVSVQEFLAAVQTSANAMKSTLGLGLLSEQMDIFTTSPLLDGSQSSDESFAIRYTNEVFAALVGEVATAVSSSALPLGGTTVVKALAQDFSDGVFDSMAWVNDDGVACAHCDVCRCQYRQHFRNGSRAAHYPGHQHGNSRPEPIFNGRSQPSRPKYTY